MDRLGLYWYGLTRLSRILHLVLAIVVILLLIGALITPAEADGYRPGQAGYKDDVRETRYSRGGDIRDYLTAEDKRQLKRIHARAVARRDGRRYASRNTEIVPARYERRSRPESLYVQTGRRCQAAIKATGEERGTMARALKSARERWRASVIDEYGYGYANLAVAVDVRTPAPAIIRYNKFGWPVYVAHIRARPCKDM